ncbi:hypothetical protein CI807_27475 [Pseudomonas sp. NS1(2017)]|uniref:hypothetical protein n=1 Tax=Pseudomonas sp. NS1(2017) TaxID=2025658 RepID=UPI000BA1CA8C|nr:hypothetical protein [Pseudomonas sp. NS1(2017)]ASV39791.1 hypothetical protein CI807_27475 [Pseudomonas sp. NS1(2017)]
MTVPTDIGKSITEAIRFVSRLGAECERLTELIREEMSRALLVPEIAKRFKVGGKWIDNRTTDENAWVYTELGISLPIISKPKRSTGSYLVVQISLTGEGINAEDNQEPLIHIGRWGDPIDFEELQMGFPLDLANEYDLILEDERLFRWVHTQYENEWCYSLRLTDINSPNDVQHHIINPTKALLLGNSATEALSGTAAVRYSRVGDKDGQYRALPR